MNSIVSEELEKNENDQVMELIDADTFAKGFVSHSSLVKSQGIVKEYGEFSRGFVWMPNASDSNPFNPPSGKGILTP